MGRKEEEAAICAIAMALNPEDYEFTVNVDGTQYDVYWFLSPNSRNAVGQIAIGIVAGKAVVPMFRSGRGTKEEAEQYIAAGEAPQ